ncbi:MAG: cryptochrome/photolyase family protein [Verrucomicrobia bacterium]|nr:cryptochrome/photolyase family protein [Verrucomicrobiota bacterium]
MSTITLIFPNQLFKHHPGLAKDRPVYLVEEYLFFRVQPFHKQRLVLLRAAMQEYAKFLQKKGFKVVYIDTGKLTKRKSLIQILKQQKIEEIHLAEFADEWLAQDLKKARLHFYPSPMFLCAEEEIRGYFNGKKHYSMAQFYAYMRKKLDILMEKGSPVGGKYSFDPENRKKLPRGIKIPKYPIPRSSLEVKRAISYVEHNFPDAIGQTAPFLYPINFTQAEALLRDFVEKRLENFGDYEDAIVENESFLFHSVLSPLLNIGLITPEQVIGEALSNKIALNSLEGFVRQIIGWREFIRACYLLKGNAQRCSNGFHHKAKLPKGFWDGTTGIPPIDSTIRRILNTGYCHHIERLMVLGNFLLLTETDPNEVYKWFMGYFVDAYDWVMVPNVYGMSQYADQGQMTTKPYICGSNYILKMSDYSKGDWVEIWDGLYWRFIAKHKRLFNANPRSKMLLSHLTKNKEAIGNKIAIAEKWLKNR